MIELDSIETNEKVSNLNVYEIERIVTKKTVYIERDIHKKSHDEWRIKYLDWRNNVNEWKTQDELYCSELLKKFEKKQISNNSLVSIQRSRRRR